MSPLTNYTFASPWWLLALLVLPLLVWVRGRRGAPVLVVPYAASWHRPTIVPSSRWPALLALSGLVLLIVALARPQIVEDKREVKQQGYDLMLAIDLSGSMLAEDYERGGERINRLQAIKPIIQAFISQRTSDRIGLVVFSGRAYTLAPLTFDHDWLARQVGRLKLGMIEDGTAIGDGLGVALTRLEQAGREEGNKRKGAFVVLLTDGANNRGLLTPEQSTEIAKSRGVPVYTIGVGKDGLVLMPAFDEQGNKIGYSRRISDLDEGALVQIANETGAKFFRAMDVGAIENTFAAIDRAQKIEFQAKSYLLTTELFAWFASPGAALLLLGAFLALPPQWLARATPRRRERAAAEADAATSDAADAPPLLAIEGPHPLVVAAAVILVAVNAWLGYRAGMRATFDVPVALGRAGTALVAPLALCGLLAIFRSFRTLRMQAWIVFWVSLVVLFTSLSKLT